MGNFNQQLTSTGLTSVSFTVPLSGVYTLQGTLTCPEINAGALATSQVVTAVTQNGTGIYTGNAGATGFKFVVNCAANDVISISFTSSAAVDTAGLNLIKSVISFG